MKKRLIWIAILALVLVFFASATAVSAATVAEGTCGAEGSNLAWVLDDEGTLAISGKGKMADFESPGSNDAAPWMKYQKDILRIDVADGVNGIGDYAFCCCTNVTRAALPKKKNANHSGGASIGRGAFEECTSLPSIAIPDGVTDIMEYAFYGCSSLSSVTVPDSVRSIRNEAFYRCSALTSFCIPNGMKSIEKATFYECTSLESITIPNSVTEIKAYAFNDCSSLTSVVIPNGVTTIGLEAFGGCGSLTSITIPDSVTSIGRLAFRDCCSLTSVTIPEGVKTIEFAAFRNCVKLGSITIGKGLEAMEQSVFQECRATKMILMSRLLSKTSVKGCLKGSNIRTVVVNVGSKTANRRCVRKYKKIFTTKNVGRKVRVK